MKLKAFCLCMLIFLKNFKILLLSILIIQIIGCNDESSVIDHQKESDESFLNDRDTIDSIGNIDQDYKTLLSSMIDVPKGCVFLKECSGDLDKDEIPERVIVYDTERYSDYGSEREIHIYKIVENKWVLWHKSIGAVMSSEMGGEIGDSFREISIDYGRINIIHELVECSYEHYYEFIDAQWKLVIVENFFGEPEPCSLTESCTFNLLTGDISIIAEGEDCGEGNYADLYAEDRYYTFECELNIKLAIVPDMDGYNIGENYLPTECTWKGENGRKYVPRDFYY